MTRSAFEETLQHFPGLLDSTSKDLAAIVAVKTRRVRTKAYTRRAPRSEVELALVELLRSNPPFLDSRLVKAAMAAQGFSTNQTQCARVRLGLCLLQEGDHWRKRTYWGLPRHIPRRNELTDSASATATVAPDVRTQSTTN